MGRAIHSTIQNATTSSHTILPGSRLFDAVKRGPVGWADQLFHGFGPRGGFGILFDDLVAGFCTLLVIAWWRF